MRRPGPDAFLCSTGPACNNNCTVCPVDRTAPVPAATSLLAQLRQARESGRRTAVLAGGEPLLRGDIFGVVRAARGLGLDVSIVTNGRLLHYETVRRRLADSGCGHVRVQLFGGDAATHDATTRTPGSFEQALAGVEALQKERGGDVEIELALWLTPESAHDVHDAVERIAARLPFFEVGIFLSVYPAPSETHAVGSPFRVGVEALAGWNARRPLGPLLAWEDADATLVPAPRHLRADPPAGACYCGRPVADARVRPSLPAATIPMTGRVDRERMPDAVARAQRPDERGAEPTHRREERWLTLAMRRMRGRVLDASVDERLQGPIVSALARDRLVEHHRVTTLEDYTPAAGYFDYVLALGSVDHFTDLPLALAKMARALRPGGSVLLTGSTPLAQLHEHASAPPREMPTPRPRSSSFDIWPEIRLLPLRVIFHRPVSLETGNLWILQAMKV